MAVRPDAAILEGRAVVLGEVVKDEHPESAWLAEHRWVGGWGRPRKSVNAQAVRHPARAKVAAEAMVGCGGGQAPCECAEGWEACGESCGLDACDCSCAGHAVSCDAAARACDSTCFAGWARGPPAPSGCATRPGAPAAAADADSRPPPSTNGADGPGCVVAATAWNKLRSVCGGAEQLCDQRRHPRRVLRLGRCCVWRRWPWRRRPILWWIAPGRQ